MAENVKVGGAYVEVSADTTKLRANLGEAKKQTQQFAAEGEKSASKYSSAFGRAAESVKKGLGQQIQLFTSLIGRVTAVIGVFITFYKLGKEINEMLKTGKERAEEFVTALDATTSPKSRAEALQAELDQVNARIAASSESMWSNIVNANKRGMQEEAEALERSLADALKQAEAARRDALRKQEDDRFSALAKDIEAYYSAEDKKAEYERQKRQEALREAELDFRESQKKMTEDWTKEMNARVDKMKDAIGSAFREAMQQQASASNAALQNIATDISRMKHLVELQARNGQIINRN